MYTVGIDIGGTNIEFALVDDKGNLHHLTKVKTANYKTPQQFIDYLFVQLAPYISSIKGIGIGAPNGNSHTGEIQYAPNLLWKGIVPLRKMFEEKFNLPTYLTNDANAAAYGEMLFGNAKDLSDFVCVTLGTGLGSGIVINKEVLLGKHGVAGEFGHIRVQPNGRVCQCGRNGCLERYASATGMLLTFEEFKLKHNEFSSLNQLENINTQAIFEAAMQKDVLALKIVDYTAEILGNALADFACFSDPEAYILVGGIAKNGDFFAQKVQQVLNKNVLKILQHTIEIRTSSLHESNSAILGTAAAMIRSTHLKTFDDDKKMLR